MNKRKDAEYQSVAEIAECVGVDQRTIRRLIKTGGLPAVRLGRSMRIPHSEFNEWISLRRVIKEKEQPQSAEPATQPRKS